MKKNFYIALLILLSVSISSCLSPRTSQLEATNAALSNQVNTLQTQLTQEGITPIQPTQGLSSMSTESVSPTEIPSPATSPLPLQEAGAVAPSLIYSGSGEITPWSNPKAVHNVLFSAANVHMLCDPNDTTDGKIWIDNKNYSISCAPNSESWTLWKPDITAGDHYIYSQNANDKYEFWTIGTTPFKISTKFSYSDFIFKVNRKGIYNLTGDVLSGAFNLYITCEGAQNFSYTNISESMTAQLVMTPATCELLVRNQPPGTLSPGEIDVSLEFEK